METKQAVSNYLESLAPGQRQLVEKVRKLVLKHLPEGYDEVFQHGMIAYVVPLERYPLGYRGDQKTPLPYMMLAGQKNHAALYSMSLYGDETLTQWLEAEYKKHGKKLDMGKSCLRLKSEDDVLDEVLVRLVKQDSVEAWIEHYQAILKR